MLDLIFYIGPGSMTSIICDLFDYPSFYVLLTR